MKRKKSGTKGLELVTILVKGEPIEGSLKCSKCQREYEIEGKCLRLEA